MLVLRVGTWVGTPAWYSKLVQYCGLVLRVGTQNWVDTLGWYSRLVLWVGTPGWYSGLVLQVATAGLVKHG